MRRRCHAAEGSGHRETRPWASPSSSSIIPSGLWILRSRDSTRGRGSRISLHDVWLVMPHTPLSVRPTGAGEPFRDLAASGTFPANAVLSSCSSGDRGALAILFPVSLLSHFCALRRLLEPGNESPTSVHLQLWSGVAADDRTPLRPTLASANDAAAKTSHRPELDILLPGDSSRPRPSPLSSPTLSLWPGTRLRQG